MPPAVAVLVTVGIVDCAFYGRVTVPAWNFVRFNAAGAGGGSALFGVNAWHYYMTEGLPPLLTVAIVPLVLAAREALGAPFASDAVTGVARTSRRGRVSTDLLLHVALAYVAAHSLIPHKEHRFMLPVVPLVLPYVASYVSRMHRLSGAILIATVLLQVSARARDVDSRR